MNRMPFPQMPCDDIRPFAAPNAMSLGRLVMPSCVPAQVFRGFRRASAPPGTRNELWVVPLADELAPVLRKIVEATRRQYWIDAIRIVEHRYDTLARCGQRNPAAAALAALVMHPNAAGVVLIATGNEALRIADVNECLGFERTVKQMRSLVLTEDAPGDIPGQLDEIGAKAPRVRERFELSRISVGICGYEEHTAFGDCAKTLATGLTRHKARVLVTKNRETRDVSLQMACAGAHLLIVPSGCTEMPPPFLPTVTASPDVPPAQTLREIEDMLSGNKTSAETASGEALFRPQ